MTELRLPEINRVLLSGRLTHDPEMLAGADRVLHLRDGRLASAAPA